MAMCVVGDKQGIHYNDVTMGVMASQITRKYDALFNHLFRLPLKNQSPA